MPSVRVLSSLKTIEAKKQAASIFLTRLVVFRAVFVLMWSNVQDLLAHFRLVKARDKESQD